MSRLRRLIEEEEAIGLVEVAVSLLISTVIVAGMYTWAMTVTRASAANDEVLAVIDELRSAKTELVREVRFADGVYAGADDDSFSLWDDADDSATVEVGETITYQIYADGRLVRSSDDSAIAPLLIATGVVPADSAFVVTGASLDLTIAIDLDTSDSLKARSISSTVNARNA